MAMRVRGETVAEMTGAVRAALEEAVSRPPSGAKATTEEILAIARRAREKHGTEGFLTDDDLYDENGLPR